VGERRRRMCVDFTLGGHWSRVDQRVSPTLASSGTSKHELQAYPGSPILSRPSGNPLTAPALLR
jgi:hypothetical protein